MKLILKRSYFEDATIGHLYVDGMDNPIFHTIERPWLNNVVNKSCIPPGTYQVFPYSSEKYPDVWEIQDVPNRTKILIHVGNWAADVKGCIAIGQSAGYMKLDGELQKCVTSSRHAIRELREIVGNLEEFRITIE